MSVLQTCMLSRFFFVAVSAPFVARMRRSVFAGNFLDGVNVTSLALMGVVTWHLLRAAGFTQVDTVRDLERRDRVTLGQWPG